MTIELLCMALFEIVCTVVKSKISTTVAVVLHFEMEFEIRNITEYASLYLLLYICTCNLYLYLSIYILLIYIYIPLYIPTLYFYVFVILLWNISYT